MFILPCPIRTGQACFQYPGAAYRDAPRYNEYTTNFCALRGYRVQSLSAREIWAATKPRFSVIQIAERDEKTYMSGPPLLHFGGESGNVVLRRRIVDVWAEIIMRSFVRTLRYTPVRHSLCDEILTRGIEEHHPYDGSGLLRDIHLALSKTKIKLRFEEGGFERLATACHGSDLHICKLFKMNKYTKIIRAKILYLLGKIISKLGLFALFLALSKHRQDGIIVRAQHIKQ